MEKDPTDILEKYGADALRLYLVNSPVVHAETLKFKQEGVFGVVKDVFLPWYNAYRFLVQNILRLEAESGQRFYPTQVPACKSIFFVNRHCPWRASTWQSQPGKCSGIPSIANGVAPSIHLMSSSSDVSTP